MNKSSYDVRIWGIRKYKGKRKISYTVRWTVAGQTWPETFETQALADSFRSELVAATRRGEAFSLDTGRPVSMEQQRSCPSWFAFACDYMDTHWKRDSAGHRKDRAKILANATMALLTSERGKPDEYILRQALRNWAYNTANRKTDRPADIAAALTWVENHTPPIDALKDAAVARTVLDRVTSRLSTTGGGSLSAKPATKARRILHHVLSYAVELGYLDANPLHQIRWQTPKSSHVVDRRSVPSPQQARALLDAVAATPRSGYLVMPFFAVMYLAGLRPEEAVNLRWADVALPSPAWDEDRQLWTVRDDAQGEITIRKVAPDTGRLWTDTGRQRDDRHPKGRAEGEERPVPCGARLSRILLAHREQDRNRPDGLVFFGEHGGQLATCTYQKLWRRARAAALTEEQQASPLAKRVYDLRHACVSTWLNQGVNPAQVADWAGHSVDVLLRIYTKCIDGGEDKDRRRAEGGFEGF